MTDYATKSLFLAAAVCLLTSSLASAQTLAGTVRDTSGAVLPGVTVEASSPALIEKTRTAVTDGSGQYQITNLPPGTYTITFSLQGFATVVRDGVELTGGGVTTHQRRTARGRGGRERDGDGRNAGRGRAVGPAADGARAATSCGRCRRRAATATTWRPCPPSRPPASTTASRRTPTSSRARGGRANEGVIQIDGLNVGSPFNGGGVSNYAYDMNNSIEVQVSISGGLGEADRGAPSFNIIPKTGGNNFSGNAFGSWAGKFGQSSNIDDRAARRSGFADAPALLKNWDANFSLGGPDQARPPLVLREHAHHRQLRGNAEPVREQERRQRQRLDLGQGRGRARAQRHQPAGQQRPPDQSGEPAQQGGLLLRLHDELQRLVGHARTAASAAAPATTGRPSGPGIGPGVATTSPEAGTIWNAPLSILQGTWTSPHLEPPAVRERLLGVPRPVGRRDAGRRDHRPDPRHRAVHQRRRAVRQLSLSRLARAAVAEPEARHLARVARRTCRAATT